MSSDVEMPPANIIPFEQLEGWKSSQKHNGDIDNEAAHGFSWMCDDKGKPLSNLANVLATLRADSSLKTAIALDEMLQTVCLIKPLLGTDEAAGNFSSRPINDHDVTCIQEYLQRLGLRRVGRDLVHQAVEKRAQENKYHPVREWLSNLQWDSISRVEAWLPTYLGTMKTPYTAGVGKMALVAMVARIMKPGCKVDHMLVLEGAQGVGKSTVCHILGGAYFSDTLPPINGHKDAYLHLAGKWIIEIPEMFTFTAADTNKLKSFISGTEDKFRPPYGRKEVQQPRQCAFIGTTNQTTYLKDGTGGRRFWPVKVGKIDKSALQTDRDQLFAEAVELYNAGTLWHPTPDFEKQYIVPEQEERYETDPWEQNIRDHLQKAKLERVYLSELFDMLHIETSSRKRSNQNRLTAILTRLDWQRLKKDSKGNVAWGPPEQE